MTCHNIGMAPPKKDHVRMVIYVSKEFSGDVKEEAKLRKKTLGDLVEEAFHQRARLIQKGKS